MEDRELTIQSFYARLTSDDDGDSGSLFAVLRQLTAISDREQLRGDVPSPLGAWSGWTG